MNDIAGEWSVYVLIDTISEVAAKAQDIAFASEKAAEQGRNTRQVAEKGHWPLKKPDRQWVKLTALQKR